MKKQYIEFKIDHQRITRADDFFVVGGTQNYLHARFMFCEDWAGEDIFAIFTGGGKSYRQPIIDGECVVPWEVLGVKRFFVGCEAGDRLVTNAAAVDVRPSGAPDADPGKPPTQTLQRQVNDLKKTTVKSVNGVEPDENGNVEIQAGVQPDWTQNDSTQPDYIKNRPFYNTVEETDIAPAQEVTFAGGKAALSGYKDPCYEMGIVSDPGSISAVLEINDDKIEGTIDYYYAASGTFGSYQLQHDTVYLGDGATVQGGETATVRLYVVNESVVAIDEKYLPKVEIPQPDWNENDETKGSHILNRPFYTIDEGDYLIEPVTLTYDVGSYVPNESIDWSLLNRTSESIYFLWNGVKYTGGWFWHKWAEQYLWQSADDVPFTFTGQGSPPQRKDATNAASVTFAAATKLPEYQAVPDKYLPKLSGATDDANGTGGIVPGPVAGGQKYILYGDGMWAPPPYNPITVVDKSGSDDAISLWREDGWYLMRGSVFIDVRVADIDAYITYDDFVLVSIRTISDSEKNVLVIGGDDYPIKCWTVNYLQGAYYPTEYKGSVLGSVSVGYPESIILRSSTTASGKRFSITVDDSGTLSATEIV